MNVSSEFIEKFKLANARIQNSNSDTPFHVAAKSTNPRTIIHMLNTFAPSKFGWDIDDADRNREPPLPTLLSICACGGNADATALLIQHGANLSKDVLRDIVAQSVECPEKTEQLVAVYRVIVDNAVTWRCLKDKVKLITKASSQYDECLRQTMMWLITRPDEPNSNVIKYAIKTGASEILEEIFNTHGVFRFDSKKETLFDITNFMLKTKGDVTKTAQDELNRLTLAQSKRNYYFEPYPFSYLCYLIKNSSKWYETRILEKEPIKELTKPYIRFTQTCYFVIAVLQLLYMICFSYYYIPTTCSLIKLFNLNFPANSSCSSIADNRSSTMQSQLPSNPSWIWLIWPSILLAQGSFVGLLPLLILAMVIIFVLSKLYKRLTGKNLVGCKPSEFITSLIGQQFSSVAFCISFFVWYTEYCDKTNYVSYVKVTAMVLLFGWITEFFLFSKTSMKFCLFSQVLREIIVKDIALSFLLVFLFTFVGFSFAMHTLRMSELPSDDVVYLAGTVYDVFAAATGTGEYFQEARDERSNARIRFDLFDVVVVGYVCVTAIILLNVLIAMINQRYDKAMLRAENIWRFHMLTMALIFEFVRGQFVKQPRDDESNQQGYYYCCCGQRCCYCKREKLIPRSRRVLKVKRF